MLSIALDLFNINRIPYWKILMMAIEPQGSDFRMSKHTGFPRLSTILSRIRSFDDTHNPLPIARNSMLVVVTVY